MQFSLFGPKRCANCTVVIRTLLNHTYVTISDNTKNNILEQSKIHCHHHQNLHQVHYHYQFPSILCFPYFHIGIILCIVNPFSYISTSWCCTAFLHHHHLDMAGPQKQLIWTSNGAQWKVLQIVFLKLHHVMCRCKKGCNTKRCS